LREQKGDSPVASWVFDGVKYADSDESLEKVRRLSLTENDVVDIVIPGVDDLQHMFPPGCFLPALMNHWYRNCVGLRLFRGKEQLSVVAVSWQGDQEGRKPENAVYELNGKRIGEREVARIALSEVKVGKDVVILKFAPDKYENGCEPQGSEFLSEFMIKWQKLGASTWSIRDYEAPYADNYPGDNPFPGDERPVDERRRQHTFTWRFAMPRDGYLVSTWLFDGSEFANSDEGLHQLESVPMNSRHVVAIAVPETETAFPLPAAGRCLSMLLNHWYRRGVKLEFYHGKERLKVTLITWHGDDDERRPDDAVYELNGEVIGRKQYAERVFRELGVDRNSAILILSPHKSSEQRRASVPDFLSRFTLKWREQGARDAFMRDYRHPLVGAQMAVPPQVPVAEEKKAPAPERKE
jgi:hypothetical protein